MNRRIKTLRRGPRRIFANSPARKTSSWPDRGKKPFTAENAETGRAGEPTTSWISLRPLRLCVRNGGQSLGLDNPNLPCSERERRAGYKLLCRMATKTKSIKNSAGKKNSKPSVSPNGRPTAKASAVRINEYGIPDWRLEQPEFEVIEISAG